ncbi:(2Fe-2S)-binding protein [Paenibacillus sp. Root444D2]|uniref:(2Fe-2S)-binding protein n=1 Tax=Paenibacillus sp. Root444D2 TaxID=1736538 RepID=UPI00070F3093|nr:(2Fe-2S)-binding protein [Paenibacillus sp. Root444D2]KQX68330.1 pyridine nucleotide-disulfide oxidoreductase [Paenibacillus sp. Root444D2]
MNMTSVIICRCEEVSLAHLLETAKQYPCSSRELKLRTRAGMGYCGGRTCRLLVDKIVQELSDALNSNEIPLKHQPPVRPVSFCSLGGEQP